MLEERLDTNDGHKLTRFFTGLVYRVGENIADSLARKFISNGWATEV